MKTATSRSAVRSWRRGAPEPVGFVATMGYLHEGHLSLVRRARTENRSVAASIFVNPTQFGPAEDLAAYPRDLDRDLGLLAAAGCDLVFCPPADEMYPPGFDTWVAVGTVGEALEGAARPVHFRGVATVVLKLLNIVSPNRAYFGQKDAQQLAVVRRMVADLDVPVDVVACPTVREADGLAMSSRNTYLSGAERAAAPVIHRALAAARDAWRGGESDAGALRRHVTGILAAEPLVEAEYVSVADPDTITEVDDAFAGALVSVAARVGATRLIDNVILRPAQDPDDTPTE
ncbi:MAG: pantoate--beta-alanine ligase [Anaerolineae bacterium]